MTVTAPKDFMPCPFCGRQPNTTSRARSPYEIDESGDYGTIFFVFCFCGTYSARAHQYGYSVEEVLLKWNNRVELPKE